MPRFLKNAKESRDDPPRVGTGFAGSKVNCTCSLTVGVSESTPPSHEFDCAAPPSSRIVGASCGGQLGDVLNASSPTPHICTVLGASLRSGLPFNVWSNHSSMIGH